MENGVIKTYKQSRRIICYITHYNGVFTACTGKPSDATCIGWKCDNLDKAISLAEEYFDNITNFFK